MKKFLCVILTVAILATMCCVAASAEENNFTITLSVSEINENNEVTVTANASNNPGISAYDFNLKYNTNVFVPKSFNINEDLYKGISASNCELKNFEYVTLAYAHSDLTVENGDMFTVTFVLKDGATYDASTDTNFYLTYSYGDVTGFNESYEQITYSPKVVNSKFEVKESASTDNNSNTDDKIDETKKESNISDWAKSEVTAAQEKDIVPEVLLNADLTKSITRKEFAALSVKLYETMSKTTVEKTLENPFKDTQDENVLKAYSLGIVKGMSDNEFMPDENISREQVATMLYRTLEILKIDTKVDLSVVSKFADDEFIDLWAKDSVYFMSEKGIIKGVGDNKFAPKNVTEEQIKSGYANTTREASVALANRIVDTF